VKFSQKSVHQKLLKSVHFSLSYSKYENGGFVRRSVYVYVNVDYAEKGTKATKPEYMRCNEVIDITRRHVGGILNMNKNWVNC